LVFSKREKNFVAQSVAFPGIIFSFPFVVTPVWQNYLVLAVQ